MCFYVYIGESRFQALFQRRRLHTRLRADVHTGGGVGPGQSFPPGPGPDRGAEGGFQTESGL